MKKEEITKTLNTLLSISSCPHCASTSIVRNGHRNATQQYKCKHCHKNFIATTGTPTHGLHLRDKIVKYTEALMQGLSVRKAAQYAEISKHTSFSWRHKFLSSINNEELVKEKETPLAVTIIKTKYNDKGRQKIPEKVRKDSRTIMTISNNQITINRLHNKPIIKQIAQILSTKKIITPIKNKELTIVTQKLHKNQVIKQKEIKATLKENITNQVNTLEKWMTRFRGVATKYLQQYWNWFCGIQNIKMLKNEKEMFLSLCVKNQSLQKYRHLRDL